MSKAKIYIYIITVLWSYIIALLGPVLFTGKINPAESNNVFAKLFYTNYFFITSYIVSAESEYEIFLYNMLSTLIVSLVLSYIITKVAVEKKYQTKLPEIPGSD